MISIVGGIERLIMLFECDGLGGACKPLLSPVIAGNTPSLKNKSQARGNLWGHRKLSRRAIALEGSQAGVTRCSEQRSRDDSSSFFSSHRRSPFSTAALFGCANPSPPGHRRARRSRLQSHRINPMVTKILMPTFANAGVGLSVGRWFKRAGDPVSFDEPLPEIDTDNLTHEIRAPVTGVLSQI